MQLLHLVLIVGAFGVGVAVRTLYVVPLAVGVWILLLALGLVVVGRTKSRAFCAPYVLLISICLVALALGIIRTEIYSWQFGDSSLQSSLGQDVELVGIVVREPDYRERTVQLYTKVDTDIILVTADRQLAVRYGDEISVAGKLSQPEAFETDLGRTFPYPEYLKARGVEYSVSFAKVNVLSQGNGSVLLWQLLAAKQAFIATLEQSIPEPYVGLGTGLLLGVKSALGDDIETDFRRTGIIHIVVLSGYNVMLVVAFIIFCLSFFCSLRWRVVAAIVAITAFALIVGLSATVVRASVMAGLLLIAQAIGRRYDVLRALLFAGALMIFLNPYLLLYDIGFQLSFMATLGLLLIAPQFEATVINQPNAFGAKDFFFATVATQIAVLPLLLYHIGEVSLVAIIVNVLILPVVPAAMLLTFLTGLSAMVFLPLAQLLGVCATLCLSYILLIAQWFAALPIATVALPAFSSWWVIVSYIGYGCVFWYLQRRKYSAPGVTHGWVIEDEQVVYQKSAAQRAADQNVPKMFR